MFKKIVLPILTFLLSFALIFTLAQLLVVPRDTEAQPERALIGEFSEGFGEQDVLFLGDCEIYESFSTVTLWEEYGIDAWLCGSPQQLLWHSLAMLEQAFAVGELSVVVLGVYGLRYDEPQSEAYNRMALEGLRKTPALASHIRTAMTPGESLLSYYLPLLRYHDRWDEITRRDVELLLAPKEPISYQGYLMQCGVVPDADGVPDHAGALPPIDPDFGEMATTYLARIASLCKQNDAQLILVKAPTDSWSYPWHREWEDQVRALAEELDVPYYNLLSCTEEIGLDYTTDTYDAGLHLNVIGAEKTARYFGEILRSEYAVPDRRGETLRAQKWKGLVSRYEDQKQENMP